jgi:CRP/FNR family transcriptional regulator, dissimilatory nitrate respiration regulator
MASLLRAARWCKAAGGRVISRPMNESPDIPALLKAVPLFQELSAPQIERIAAASRLRRYTKGEILFRKGEEASGFFVVIRGQIKLGVATPQGQEKVIEVIGPRQSFGEAVMFMNRPYPVFAETLLDSVLCHVAKAAVFELLDGDAGFARAMLAGLSRRLHSLVDDVETYSVRSGAQRVIGYLLQHIGEDAAPQRNAVVTLPVTKQILASRLNLTPETLSRVFHALSEAGLITVHGRQITVHDLTRLRQFDL